MEALVSSTCVRARHISDAEETQSSRCGTRLGQLVDFLALVLPVKGVSNVSLQQIHLLLQPSPLQLFPRFEERVICGGGAITERLRWPAAQRDVQESPPRLFETRR